MKSIIGPTRTALLVLAGALAAAPAANAEEILSPSRAFPANYQPPLDDLAEAAEREARLAGEKAAPFTKAATPVTDEDFISFLYLQTYDFRYHVRWHAITHVTSLFVGFDQNGNFTNRSSIWDGRPAELRAGGAAEAAGVKVVMIVQNFDDDPGGDIEQVMTNAARRANLADNIADALEFDPGNYNAGVTLDIEFSWGPAVRDGIVLFLAELRAELDSRGMQDKEISIYTNPTLSTNQWDIAGMEPHIDYLLYSGYTFASSGTVSAVGNYDGMLSSNRIPLYFSEGLPPEKMVLTLPAYGREYLGATNYGVSGTRDAPVGFNRGLFESTITGQFGGPHSNNYVTGPEVGWYTYNDGSTDITTTWEDPRAFTYKIRKALTIDDPTGGLNFQGRRLAGVGYWSSLWMSSTDSYDLRTSSNTSRTRTYPHIYQTLAETLGQRGRSEFLVTGFEGYDFRWRDPWRAIDTSGDTNNDSTWDVFAKPGGGPANSTRAARVTFDMESGSSTGVFAHEVLGQNDNPGTPDYFASAANFDSTTQLGAWINSPGVSGATVRMLAYDANQELERSPAFSLAASGWQQITWDLTDAAQVSPFTTSEPAFANGDGAIDTAGGGERDVHFYGFVVEGLPSGSTNIWFDEVTYEHANAGGLDYVINEFAYDGSAFEFVEIAGPAGPLPAGMQIRVIDGADGSVTTIPLSGTVPADGLFVAGDPAVANVDFSTGFGDATDQLLDGAPSGLQLYNSATGGVYDSVVYEAFGGLRDLVRLETLGVGDEGWPWLGRISGGTNAAGTEYSKGRYPDGADTDVNAEDFSVMVASPGLPNGGAIATGSSVTYNFDTAPASAYQTFDAFSVQAPAVGASPSGGNVHRSVDPAGGGVISFIGDKALGADGNGVRVTGEIYIPAAAEPAQAIGIGFCGTQGGTFFTSFPNSNGYENGYWLIYENQAGIGLADGRADHPGVFEFIHATHDNMDGTPAELLGSAAIGSTGASEGAWTTFELEVDPGAGTLLARIGGTDVYNGTIPTDGPVSGAVQIGFRENHSGAPVSTEGTWVDNIAISPAQVTTGVDAWIVVGEE